MYNIAIIDDHRIFLDGFELLIENMDIEANVSAYEDPQCFIEDLKKGTQFDLIVCDLVMKSMNGLSVSAAIRGHDASVPIIVLSGITAGDPTADLRRLGANGFVHKTRGYDVLIEAISTVMAGGLFFSNDGLEERQQKVTCHTIPQLWDRHMDVLHLLSGGATNKEISAALDISQNTVKTYLRQLFHELDVKTRTACVHKAQLLGLI